MKKTKTEWYKRWWAITLFIVVIIFFYFETFKNNDNKVIEERLKSIEEKTFKSNLTLDFLMQHFRFTYAYPLLYEKHGWETLCLSTCGRFCSDMGYK